MAKTRSSFAVVLVLAAGCAPTTKPVAVPATSARPAIQVSDEAVQNELRKIPVPIREQFQSKAGVEEFRRALEDKELLRLEAQRRQLHQKPEIAKQVQQLEDRLIIQALLDEEGRQITVSDAQAREWYEQNHDQLKQPERVRVARFLVSGVTGTTGPARKNATARAEALAQRLRKGEDLEKVAEDSDGPERARGGDLGFIAPGDAVDAAVSKAAFDLKAPGEVSPVFECADGLAVLKLLERRPARVPPFSEARAEIEAKMKPGLQRQVFNKLVARLRQQSGGAGLVQ